MVNNILGSNKTHKNIKCIMDSIKSQGGTFTLNHIFQKMFPTLNRYSSKQFYLIIVLS